MNTIGLAMYTVHQAAEKDLAKTLAELRTMGCEAVEWYGTIPQNLGGELAKSGLRLAGCHTEWRDLQEDRYAETVRTLKEIGCPVAVVPCLGGKWNIGHTAEQECLDVWLRYTDWLNALAPRLAADGLRLAYHNHEHEFLLHYGEKTVFDLLYENLASEIIMEFDSGNCIEGGGDPAAVLRRYAEREVMLHLKPFSRTDGFNVLLGAAKDANDWPAILSAHPFRELLIESEAANMAEMANAQACIASLRGMMAKG